MSIFLAFTNRLAPEKSVVINVDQIAYVWPVDEGGCTIVLLGGGRWSLKVEVAEPYDEVAQMLVTGSYV